MVLEKLGGGYNYHYVFLYDKSTEKDLVFVPQPYEKASRVGSVDSDTTGFQSVEGGATPTPTLQ